MSACHTHWGMRYMKISHVLIKRERSAVFMHITNSDILLTHCTVQWFKSFYPPFFQNSVHAPSLPGEASCPRWSSPSQKDFPGSHQKCASALPTEQRERWISSHWLEIELLRTNVELLHKQSNLFSCSKSTVVFHLNPSLPPTWMRSWEELHLLIYVHSIYAQYWLDMSLIENTFLVCATVSSCR